MNSSNSHRSFYMNASNKLMAIKPASSEIKNILSKPIKFDILNSEIKKSKSFHQRSLSNKMSFQTPVVTGQKNEKNEKNTHESRNLFIINKIIKNTPFLEKNERKNSGSRTFLDHLELKKIDFKNLNKRESTSSNETLSKTLFEFLYVIGKGGFGKVWKVMHKKTKKLYAMKEMMKAKVIAKRSVHSVMNERELLSTIRHPFMINMVFAFQDRENLCLVMDLMNGGDLRYHIGRQKRFSEEQTRFFVACIFESLEHLHNNNIIHRDLKPENLVLDDKGYVRLTDLGVARILKSENSCDTSGTPGYMAPEVMCRLNHGIGVDYYALGVIGFEFMFGRRPYLGRDRKEIRDAILSKQVQIKKHDIPLNWSIEAADFINKLIQRKPMNRLGTSGPQEVKNHPWLKDFQWEKLKKKELRAPFLPNIHEDNFDKKQAMNVSDTNENEELIKENTLLLKKNSIQELFNGYNFDGSNTNNGINTDRPLISTNGNLITTGSTASSVLI